MENTLENKAKFFAQYYGQNILMDISHGFKSDNEPSNWHQSFYNNYLEVKPLSSITDEDAVLLNFKDAKEFLNISAFMQNGICFFNELDLIRSLGYAVEYMGLRVEKQIEYGWVKIN